MTAPSSKPAPLADYEILLCLTGGIACYKAADLASQLVQAGSGVSAIMTEAAQKFIGPATLQGLTRREVYTSLWIGPGQGRANHIALADRADLMVVAPATANIIAKFAAGLAEDLVSTTALAVSGICPILIAPAMNSRMWAAEPTQANVSKLRQWGFHFAGPAEGNLACGTTGPGRLASPAELMNAITELLKDRPPRKRAQ